MFCQSKEIFAVWKLGSGQQHKGDCLHYEYRAQDNTGNSIFIFRMLSAASNEKNLTQTGLRMRGIYWFLYQKIQWQGRLQSGLIRVLAPFFCNYFCFITFMSQLCSESCFPYGGKMMPVIPGVHQQIAYSRWREKICISEFLAEVLKL